ncbi:MAG: uracil-DNA glycosylase family protein [Oscillospiraceae bacterium]|jgi:hypothetical protein|nr:uracil-DNA glycosylase family protein [Oscillospiraceae bacterium]
MTPKEEQLAKMYLYEGFGKCDICKECQKAAGETLNEPVGAFCVGEHFDENAIRVLFVGKVARGKYNGFNEGRRLWTEPWKFWYYTRCITNKVFGNESIENIAITNIIQCNNSEGKDLTTKETKDHCINELRAIRKEIEIIKPNKIVFYTVVNYDKYVPGIFDEFREGVNMEKDIGAKKMKWREAVGIIGGESMNILRIGHPERMNKAAYVCEVSKWIKDM